jgi:RecB family exonuclease
MEKTKKISYSQFSTWVQCPYRWKLNYIDGRREFTDSIHTLFGTSMHEVLQTYLTVMYTDTIKTADELELDTMLLQRMKENFMNILKNNGGVEFCTKEDMGEFYQHGLAILDWFKKKRGMYFSKNGYELVGIEVPIEYELPNKIKFIGYIDVLIKDTVRNKYKIIDIKTSTMGWNKWAKADKNKTNQLLLYKQFYGAQHDIPLDKIEVEYFIVKRKLYENVDFPQRRVQTFIPANGTPSINKVATELKGFMDECFVDGKYNEEHSYKKISTTKNCRWCEYKNKPELCDRKN